MKTPAIILLALTGCTAAALAVTPPPDGGYPNQTTALGDDALFSLVLGEGLGGNTAIGFRALYGTTTGFYNTAVGKLALNRNTTGDRNTAMGSEALSRNKVGEGNTAFGNVALTANIGSGNTAVGDSTLFYNTTGIINTALGSHALYRCMTGGQNTATGNDALLSNTKGSFNTATGSAALRLDTGTGNTADGANALTNKTAGGHNTALGFEAGINLTAGDENIYIANDGSPAESNTIRVGTDGSQTSTFIAGISGATVAGGVNVIIDINGRLGTVTSSARYKTNIEPMDKSSEPVLSLKPVTFRYKKELDPQDVPQFGLIAEDVAKVDSNLVARDAEGEPYTVRYEAVNAMLLNEFLKEHQTVKAQSATIEDLKRALAQQQAQIKALSEGLQKVSAQVQTKQDAPRLVWTAD